MLWFLREHNFIVSFDPIQIESRSIQLLVVELLIFIFLPCALCGVECCVYPKLSGYNTIQYETFYRAKVPGKRRLEAHPNHKIRQSQNRCTLLTLSTNGWRL